MNSTHNEAKYLSDSIKTLRKRRRIFGWLLFISSIIMVYIFWVLPQNEYETISTPVENRADITVQSSNSLLVLILVVSLLTSLFSLIGFLSSSILARRKERREVTLANLEIKKQDLELEKLRMEAKKRKY